MKFRLKYMLTTCCLLSAILTMAQASNYIKPMEDMTPKTPEAASLSKFIDMPAGNYTGTSNVSVPIYEIKTNGERFPITLDYHVSGIKVGEISGRVGLGWAMNIAGASLSKQTVGRDDRGSITNYNVNTFYPIAFSPPGSISALSYQLALSVTGAEAPPGPDTQPDVFSYSINGNSGKFIRDSEGNFHTIPYTSIKIKGNGIGIAPGYTLITDEGIRYVFTQSGYQNTIGANGSQLDNNNYKLSQIEFLNGDKIFFNYRTIHYRYLINNRATETIAVSGGNMNLACFSEDGSGNLGIRESELNYAQNSDEIITSIVFPEGKVLFGYSDEMSIPVKRQDIVDDVYCHSIKVVNNFNIAIRNFELENSYFTSSGFIPNPLLEGFELFLESMKKALYYRLKLEGVTESISGAKYKFKYNDDIEMPNRFSYDTDFWGFYNGANNISDLPKVLYENRFYGEANKEPNFAYGKSNSLKKVIFPTGGSQEIEYEQDDYFFDGIDETYDYRTFEINTANNIFNTEYAFLLDGDIDQRVEFISDPNPLGDCVDCLPIDGSNYIYGILLNQNHQQIATFYTNGEKKISFPSNQIFYLKIKKVGTGNFQSKLKFTWYKNNSQVTRKDRKIGSLRVKKIVLNPEGGKTIVKEYNYKNPQTSFSSGIWHGDKLHPYSWIKSVGYARNCHVDPFSGNLICDFSCTGTCEKLVLSNNSGINLSGVNGKSIGYDYVSEVFVNKDTLSENYSILYKFSNYPDDNILETRTSPIVPTEDNSFMRGLLLEKSLYANNGALKNKEINSYEFDTHFNSLSADNYGVTEVSKAIKIELVNICYYGNLPSYDFDWKEYRIPSAWIKQTSQQIIEYFSSGNLITLKEFFYKNDYKHIFPEKIKTTLSNGEYTEAIYKYPQDRPSEVRMQELISTNQIRNPIESAIEKNGNLLFKEQKYYININNIILPSAIYAAKFPNNFPNISPQIGQLEKKITFDKYDDKGNLLQYMLENNHPVCMIWGYNRTQVIAKIENLAYDSIPTSTITLLQSKSNTGTEADLLIALAALRSSFPNSFVTTYTYEPLIGVKSITDAKGEKAIFEYDAFGRLGKVRDHQGNLVSEKEYHYK